MPDPEEKPLPDGALLVSNDSPDDRDNDRDNDDDDDAGHAGDGKAEEALDILDGVLARMDLDTEVEVRSDDDEIVLDIDGPDAGRAIGRKGQTLDALQFLVNKIVNRFPKGRRHVIVDSGDYRERHDRGLETLAERQAEKAVDQGQVITLEPMNARDRRVVHMSLAKLDGVSTRSNGQGLGRRVQIIPSRRDRDRDRDRDN